MSAETLKFFEDKSTENIINWMLTHLTEDQIRMCLDSSGVPKMTPEPVVVPGVAGGSGVAPGDKPVPIIPKAAPSPAGGANKMQTMFLKKYRRGCIGKGYIIGEVERTPDGLDVIFWKFEGLTEEAVEEFPENVGEIDKFMWVKNRDPVKDFKDYCTEVDTMVFEADKKAHPMELNIFSDEINVVLEQYIAEGFTPPIKPREKAPEPVAETQSLFQNLTVTQEQPIDVSDPQIKAALVQQLALKEFLQSDAPQLGAVGIALPPIFIYGNTGTAIEFYTVFPKDGQLILLAGKVKHKLIKSGLKQNVNYLVNAIKSGDYVPTSTTVSEIQDQIKLLPEDVREKIRLNYTPENLSGLVFFGEKTTQMNFFGKLADQTPEFLAQYGTNKFGAEFTDKYRANVATNKFGVKNVQWVKR